GEPVVYFGGEPVLNEGLKAATITIAGNSASGSVVNQPATISISDQTPGDHTVQQIYHNGTSGTYTLTFKGQTTAPLEFHDSAARVQAGLDKIDPTAVGTGTGRADSPVTITPQTPGDNSVQLISEHGTSGSFTLTFNGKTTGAIAYNATAQNVQDALNQIAAPFQAAVTGTGTSSDPWVVTYTPITTAPTPQVVVTAQTPDNSVQQ